MTIMSLRSPPASRPFCILHTTQSPHARRRAPPAARPGNLASPAALPPLAFAPLTYITDRPSRHITAHAPNCPSPRGAQDVYWLAHVAWRGPSPRRSCHPQPPPHMPLDPSGQRPTLPARVWAPPAPLDLSAIHLALRAAPRTGTQRPSRRAHQINLLPSTLPSVAESAACMHELSVGRWQADAAFVRCLAHRLLQIGDQILLALDPGGDSDQIVRQPARLAHVRRDGCMRHEAG
mmetsp:Transcript_26363/g.59767  ORF Transcript_26363/g.59767 Transcript_26363/m.59767 type:complete len:235 (-) Transcript_26363:249-953(-)